jgi:hypothetical protein
VAQEKWYREVPLTEPRAPCAEKWHMDVPNTKPRMQYAAENANADFEEDKRRLIIELSFFICVHQHI